MRNNSTQTDIVPQSDELSKKAFKKLRQLHREKLPLERVPTYRDKTANGLTKCIIDYLNLKGYQAERILCMGVPVPVGNGTYTMGKTTMDLGTADVSATIKSLSIKIEIKAGNDKMSSHQWDYKRRIEKAGGIYIIARTFPQFLIELHRRVKI